MDDDAYWLQAFARHLIECPDCDLAALLHIDEFLCESGSCLLHKLDTKLW